MVLTRPMRRANQAAAKWERTLATRAAKKSPASSAVETPKRVKKK